LEQFDAQLKTGLVRRLNELPRGSGRRALPPMNLEAESLLMARERVVNTDTQIPRTPRGF